MFEFVIIFVILAIIYSLKNRKNGDMKFLNALFITNLVVFLIPLAIAFIGSLPNGNMWSENGAGAVLWLYILLIPICSIVLIIWFVLLISYWNKNRK